MPDAARRKVFDVAAVMGFSWQTPKPRRGDLNEDYDQCGGIRASISRRIKGKPRHHMDITNPTVEAEIENDVDKLNLDESIDSYIFACQLCPWCSGKVIIPSNLSVLCPDCNMPLGCWTDAAQPTDISTKTTSDSAVASTCSTPPARSDSSSSMCRLSSEDMDGETKAWTSRPKRISSLTLADEDWEKHNITTVMVSFTGKELTTTCFRKKLAPWCGQIDYCYKPRGREEAYVNFKTSGMAAAFRHNCTSSWSVKRAAVQGLQANCFNWLKKNCDRETGKVKHNGIHNRALWPWTEDSTILDRMRFSSHRQTATFSEDVSQLVHQLAPKRVPTSKAQHGCM